MQSQNKVVHVALEGGLGNQLFQFANGVALALKNDALLCLHWNHPRGTTPRNFDLDFLSLKTNVPYVVEANKTLILTPFLGKSSVIKCVIASKRKEFIENSFNYSPFIFSKKEIYLKGYYQSWRYFENFQSEIREFISMGLKNHAVKSKFFNGFSNYPNMLHLRFGDYLLKPFSEVNGSLRSTYYAKGLDLLNIRNQSILCVTDDVDLAQSKLSKLVPNFTFPSHRDPLMDLLYLSMATNIIIANSTFSWWGAYLAIDASVIAPRDWFTIQVLRTKNICDLFPESWILL